MPNEPLQKLTQEQVCQQIEDVAAAALAWLKRTPMDATPAWFLILSGIAPRIRMHGVATLASSPEIPSPELDAMLRADLDLPPVEALASSSSDRGQESLPTICPRCKHPLTYFEAYRPGECGFEGQFVCGCRCGDATAERGQARTAPDEGK